MTAIVQVSTDGLVENVGVFGGSSEIRLEMLGNRSRARRVEFYAGEPGMLISGNDVHVSDVLTGSGLGDSCIEVTGLRAHLTDITSSDSGVASGIRVNGGADCVIDGFTSNGDDTGLEILNATRWQARGVSVIASDNEGVLVTGSDHGIFEGMVYNSGRHGISISDSSYNRLSGQVIDAGKDTNNTYDGVILAGNSDRNRTAFTVTYLGSGNQARYGLNISASTCDNNIEASLLLAGATATYNNAGTATVATDDHIIA